MTDKELLGWYMKGWEDELFGIQNGIPDDLLIQRAYNIGAADCIAGDDVRNFDYQSEEEILKRIKS